MDTAAAPAPASRIGTLRVEKLGLTYASSSGDRFTVLDIDRMEIEPGAIVGLTGPSGSGKTSLLYTLTGIEAPERGSIRWGDTDPDGNPAQVRMELSTNEAIKRGAMPNPRCDRSVGPPGAADADKVMSRCPYARDGLSRR